MIRVRPAGSGGRPRPAPARSRGSPARRAGGPGKALDARGRRPQTGSVVRPLTSRPGLGPGAHAERELLSALLGGRFRPGDALPAERELAASLGVTRPTLREVLKKLDRDGFVTVRHGLPTRVNDVWTEGGLNVLSALAEHGEIPKGFVKQLLEVRVVLAPAYAREAVRHEPARVAGLLSRPPEAAATPREWAEFDWELHRLLAVASGNPVYALILNGFRSLFARMAALYFERPSARSASRDYYAALREAALAPDAARAEEVTRDVMTRSVALWRPLERRLAEGRGR